MTILLNHRFVLSSLLALGGGAWLVALAATAGAPPPLECIPASDLDRVFEDGYGSLTPGQSELSLFGLRGETVSGQVVVVAQEQLDDLTLSVGPLQLSPVPGTIPQENVQWNFIGGIFIATNSPNREVSGLLRPAPAWFPDVLTEVQKCSVPKGARKAAYLTVKIPRDAVAGEYRTTITARAGGISVALPMALQVYPLSLPEERHLQVTEWYSTYAFQKHHQMESADDNHFLRLLKVYAENMVDHRQNVFRVGLDLIQSRRNADRKFQFDFSRFDQWAQVFWDTGRMDLLETGFIAQFGPGGWSSREILLDQFKVKGPTGEWLSLSGEEFLPQFLPAFVSHLREKGWLAKTVFHICDEPSNHNVMAWRQASDLVQRWAPELRRIDAIETPLCLGALEIWVPKLDHLATWQAACEAAQRQGAEMWFYTVGIFQAGSLLNKTVDVPLIETRLMHWLNYRYHLQGYLHWGFNEWTDDPIRSPGEHRGDGWHVYPKKDGLLNSMRWEQMRNGLQDYECLWLLEHDIAQIKAKLPARVAALIDPRQRGVEIASQVVADYFQHSRNPVELYQAKRQAITETLALQQAPRLVLQTSPLEHTVVARNCAIDVHGWAEPGTVLKANGQPVPVASDGLFLLEVAPSAEGEIVVEAQGQTGQKRLVRHFPRPQP